LKRFAIRLAIAGVGVAAALAPVAASADSCANFSRNAPPTGATNCYVPDVGQTYCQGNWVWLGFAWGFGPPGSIDSQALQLPDANGNYQDKQGTLSSLLDNSNVCAANGQGQSATNRQQGALANGTAPHGVWSGCTE
jgi:hypothetical protein